MDALPIQRLTHVGICVSELERSTRFYRELLGFVPEHELAVEGEPTDTLLRLRGTKLTAVYLARDGVRIELLHFARPPAPPRRERAMNEHGLTHLSFRVADLEAVLAGLRAAGERVLEDTVLRFPEPGPPSRPDGQPGAGAGVRRRRARLATSPVRGLQFPAERRGVGPIQPSSLSSAMRSSHDASRRARSVCRMTPPTSPPSGPYRLKATRGVSRNRVTRSDAPSASGITSASTWWSGTILVIGFSELAPGPLPPAAH
jgi:catechol 2,3-dioxygenase-like lactoylglutathione lyase family enzyme